MNKHKQTNDLDQRWRVIACATSVTFFDFQT